MKFNGFSTFISLWCHFSVRCCCPLLRKPVQQKTCLASVKKSLPHTKCTTRGWSAIIALKLQVRNRLNLNPSLHCILSGLAKLQIESISALALIHGLSSLCEIFTTCEHSFDSTKLSGLLRTMTETSKHHTAKGKEKGKQILNSNTTNTCNQF